METERNFKKSNGNNNTWYRPAAPFGIVKSCKILKSMAGEDEQLKLFSEAHSEPSQTSKCNLLFAKIPFSCLLKAINH